MQFSITALDGAVTTVTLDGDTLHIRNRADAQSVLDQNQIIRAANGDGITRNHDQWRHVARLDMMTYLTLTQQGVISDDDSVDQKRFRAWLNNRDFRNFRTTEGSV